MSDELDLVHRALAGDGAAFERLITPLEPSLRSLIQGQIWTRGDLSADEVLQDARIYLQARLDRYNPEYPFAVFARALTRTIIKRHRARRGDLAPGSEDAEEFSTELSPTELSALPRHAADLLGAGRFDAPDGPPPPSREFLELFEALLAHGGYPHQQLSFGYSVVLWGRCDRRPAAEPRRPAPPPKSQKVPITGDPDRVVVEVGPRALTPAADDLLDEIESSLRLDPIYLGRVRRPLDAGLAQTGEALFGPDPAARRAYPGLLGERIGDTRLSDYFGKDPRQSVSDWTRGVKERLRRHYAAAQTGRGAEPRAPGPSQKSPTRGV